MATLKFTSTLCPPLDDVDRLLHHFEGLERRFGVRTTIGVQHLRGRALLLAVQVSHVRQVSRVKIRVAAMRIVEAHGWTSTASVVTDGRPSSKRWGLRCCGVHGGRAVEPAQPGLEVTSERRGSPATWKKNAPSRLGTR